MAIAFRAVNSGDSGSGTVNNFNATVDASALKDDVAVLIIAQNGTQAITATGWTIDPNTPVTTSGNNNRLTVYTRKLVAADAGASFNITFAGSQRFDWAVVVLSGANAFDISAVNNNNTQAATVDAPTVDPTGTDSLWLVAIAGRNSTNGATVTWTAGGGMTERVDRCTSAAAAPNTDLFVGTQVVSSSSPTGTATQTPSLSVSYCVISLIVSPAATQTVSPDGIASASSLGQPTVTPGAVTVSPSSIASGAALGAPTITSLVTVSPSSIASGAALGAPTLTAGAVTVSPGGIASGSSLGTPTISTGGITVSPDGIAAASALGTPTISPGAVTISPDGITSNASLGAPTILATTIVSPSSISSTSSLGTPTITVAAPPSAARGTIRLLSAAPARALPSRSVVTLP